MSEEIDLGANISIAEDAFAKFESGTMFEEDEYITLSDIVPPRPSVPDLSHELNEIPFDNEVVLGSPPVDTNDGQVNRLVSAAGAQLLDISEHNVIESLEIGGDDFHDNGINRQHQSNQLAQERRDLSADGLGAQNYVIEDSASMIQDSLLSTTVDQNDTQFETNAQDGEGLTYPRRTKRGRIPNTAKYPQTSTTPDSGTTKTQLKRRPGRPKKVSLVQTTFEPDSTNTEGSGLYPENGNGSATDGSILEESTPNSDGKKRRRGRPKVLKETVKPTPPPSKRGRRSTKGVPCMTNEVLIDNQLVESSKTDEIESQINLAPQPNHKVKSLTSTSPKNKRGQKKGAKAIIESANNELEITEPCENDTDDDADDVCLSKLKSNLELEELPKPDIIVPTDVVQNNADATINDGADIKSTNELQNDNVLQNEVVNKPVVVVQNVEEDISSPSKRSSKMPIMSDFEYNIDKVVKEATTDEQSTGVAENECLLVEDTSKRRRTAKKTFVYDEGSDEDPFANVESSDDEPKRKKKSSRYLSDDEYVPGSSGGGSGKKRGKIRSSSSDSESEDIDECDDLTKTKKKKGFSPMKGRKSLDNKPFEVTTINPNKAQDDDIEVCLQSSVIKVDEALKPPAEAWATSNAFENFIAQKNTGLQVKKVSSQEKIEKFAPLEIPVLDPLEPKKAIETSTQTKKPSLASTSAQTSAPYDIPMKINTDLTSGQSEKACEFLSSVVKTTVELGKLMSQKSEDFMKKKINTEHVTDTFKMDYCVRKSFLLFKLAKHNLLQMEEDLAKQYDQFLEENNLSSCRELPKKITPRAKEADSDSDCEIVEVLGVTSSVAPVPKKDKKSTANPSKTVFLNKELSIKIAKKAPAPVTPSPGKKKLDIKGRHAVWINKNVMVKKVTPTQSFLAQDSRNKKPPDTIITKKMVSDFFEGYYREKALSVCAPYVNTDWSSVRREYACHYFVHEFDGANTSRNNYDLSAVTAENSIDMPDENHNINSENPKSLFTLCTEAICKYFHNNPEPTTEKQKCNFTDGTTAEGPLTLFRLCINALKTDYHHSVHQHKPCHREDYNTENNDDSLDLHEDLDNTEWKSEESNDHFANDSDLTEKNDSECNTVYMYENIKEHETKDSSNQATVLPLTHICYQKVVDIVYESETFPTKIPEEVDEDLESLDSYLNIEEEIYQDQDFILRSNNLHKKRIKTLFSLCVQFIQSFQNGIKSPNLKTSLHPNVSSLKPLRTIAFETVRDILHARCEEISEAQSIETTDNLTINCINTLSEDAFERIQGKVENTHLDDFDDNQDDDFNNEEIDFNPDTEDNGWAAQLQVQEFRSCYMPHLTDTLEEETNQPVQELHEVLPQIKTEPVDDYTAENIDTSIVKTEPIQSLQASNEMTLIPDSIVPKTELIDSASTTNRVGSPPTPGSSSFNVDTFERFVMTNKMVQFMDDAANDEIFSQSALRIRRQHEPDLDQGNDTSMSLLVPHTFEPLHVVNAKGSLMESSSDNDDNCRKNSRKKKLDKKTKKTKKDLKSGKETINTVKDKILPESEVAVLTRRMREKIRQEEKKIESSDSEAENLYLLGAKKDKSKKENDKILQEEKKTKSSDDESDILYMLNTKKDESNEVTEKEIRDEEKIHSQSDVETENLYKLASKKDKRKKNNDKTDNKKLQKNKHISEDDKHNEDDIQCNNVDSTEKITDKQIEGQDKFSGFTAIDQNEISNYHKLMQFVYDKIIPTEDNGDNSTIEANTGPVIHPDEPVELLECEPTMPIFDEDPKERPGPKKSKAKNIKASEVLKEKKPQFTDRHGWHCYSFDCNDEKLYKNAQILLEKLPESFVETYMEYQNVMDKDLDDQEVDRLINLQSLNRSITVKDIKELKSKSRPKGAKDPSISGNRSRSNSPADSDHYEELVPSDDEGPNVEDEIPPPMPVRSSENNLAKNLLMDDHDSDSDGAGGKKIKEEPNDPSEKPRRAGPKSKTKLANVESESLMLTADKMMNKELALLHAPIVLKEDAVEMKHQPTTKEDIKPSKKISPKTPRERVKNDDDSSSEEEKQWVSTKEKLLKRMGKKEDAVADDAKRAKLVTEFIERRQADRKNTRSSGDVRRTRNRRKALERQKQLRFLKNELFGETDGVQTKRGAAAGLFKGRRNIRKVIDKKSLARSTVVANMEEFERKRRLNLRQNRLREVLGCEEGVNVLVINDEVCLEYDFEQQRPVVTVHQFFTKVMKAHQYEGVKFMWDACFESLGTLEAGHPGGGCILAHCMGLGKTLQVLALLHTVLTHPRAGMHRVLVCCPLSTVLNWVDEIHKWIGPVTHEIKVFELSKLRKTYERAYQLEDWYSGGGIFIIGYELFRSLTTLDPEIDDIRPTIINKIRTALLDPGPDIIVCDEGHLLKNDCSVLAVAMSRVVTKRRIVLTGTPMQNNLREYFCMVNFIKPNLLGTYSEYSNRFENPIMNGQHRDSRQEDIKLMKARTHILHKVLEGCLQRQEASVLYPYLPKKHEYTVFIPLTKCQWDLYNHYMDNYTRTSKQSVLRDFHILQKIWSHPQVLHNFHMKARDKKDKIKAEKIEDDLAQEDQEDIKPPETEVWWLQYLSDGAMLNTLDSSNKFVAVFRILHECVALGDKVLIFSTSLFCLDALEFFLKTIEKWSLGQDYYRLDGSVPAEVRQKWCREFNAENNLKTKLFLISTRAGCLGLNMTAANRVIILDTSWNPAHDIQSIFRVYRFGQKKDCYIYRLVALGTMEQKIYERSVTKQAVACRVVDEQQIDRHYNLAELTELYSVDEMGISVAGGVAVGVSDVALLRVARDAAVHAVHEHDSLLRGSSEQGLPEHERAAAWNQFQQEHEHKQMQNDISANKAKVALKRLEMKHLREQAMYPHPPAPDPVVKEEPDATTSLLVPKEEVREYKQRGRKPKISKIVQCRIPIAINQPGSSVADASQYDEYERQQEMVGKITNLLIKHNFMKNKAGHKTISDLVAKVKQMVATGQPMTLGPGYDELSSSIANVLLHREEPPMPALTDIERMPARGRPKKTIREPSPDIPHPPLPPLVPIEDGRRRRRAALAAEKQFDSQKDIIDLDDDGDEWQNDTGIIDDDPVFYPEPEVEPPPKEPEKQAKAKPTAPESSIVLSDDEPVTEVIEPTAPNEPAPVPEDVVALHPSLLTNANFIKIVAHTYLAGNPMMDEDAATLAAQYSTLKTLKESESEGKPIESGPVYDIAVQVLGKEVLRKLQAANPSVKDSTGDTCLATKKMQSLLGGNTEAAAPSPPVKKPKIGPKSRVMKDVKQEPGAPVPDASPKLRVKSLPTTFKAAPIVMPKLTPFAPSGALRAECILPDDDVIIDPEPVDKKPIILKKFKIGLSMQRNQSPQAPSVTPVALGRGPAETQATPTQAPPPQVSDGSGTICLDSDDDEPAPTPQLKRRFVQLTNPSSAPVPVALTGPNARPITLPPIPSLGITSASQAPVFYTLSPLQSRNRSSNADAYSQPVPISLTGPGPNPQPVPISLTGPGMQPVSFSQDAPHPISHPVQHVSAYTGSGRLQPVSFTGPNSQVNYMGGRSQPVPISLTGPGAQPVPISLVGPDSQPMSLGSQQPVPISLVGADGRPVSFSTGIPQSGTPLSLRFSNQQTPPTNTATPTASRTLRNERQKQSAPSVVPGTSTAQPNEVQQPSKTVCKPGDVFRISKSGVVEILSRKLGRTSSSEVLTHKTSEKGGTASASKPAVSTPVAPKPVAANPAVAKPAPKPAVAKPAPKPAMVDTPAPDNRTEHARKQTIRKISSSSSSSSGRSRSCSPDPLAILKDVVHIQAPDKPTPTLAKPPVTPSYKPSYTKTKAPSTSNAKPQLTLSTSAKATNKQDAKSNISQTTISRTSRKTDLKPKPNLTESVDLTMLDEPTLQPSRPQRPSTSKDGNSSRSQVNTHTLSRSTGTRLDPKPGTPKTKPSTSANKKVETPTKLVGTSKSIVLDGKTKSLKVEGASSSSVSSSRTSQSSSTNRPKQVDKRPAPSAPAPAPKKKKTEPMTLKDFDIDDELDIDNIIELD